MKFSGGVWRRYSASYPATSYVYGAWGNPLTTTGTMADTLGKLNPFRYRGYVYDTETGLYYLGSRYYNPQWGRFVNADGVVDTLETRLDCLSVPVVQQRL